MTECHWCKRQYNPRYIQCTAGALSLWIKVPTTVCLKFACENHCKKHPAARLTSALSCTMLETCLLPLKQLSLCIWNDMIAAGGVDVEASSGHWIPTVEECHRLWTVIVQYFTSSVPGYGLTLTKIVMGVGQQTCRLKCCPVRFGTTDRGQHARDQTHDAQTCKHKTHT